ncbi:MAG: ATP-binding protein [Planctomycetota bacterium]
MEVDLGSLVRSVIKMSQADEQQPTFLFLDELTYAKNWDKWLKTFYDENWPVQIAGSSSATALLRDKRTESGVGRWEEQYLAPYLIGGFLALLGRQVPAISGDNLSEVVDQLFSDPPSPAGLSEIRRRLILVGGFPELILDDESRQDNLADGLFRSQRILRTDAIERTIYRDIPQAYGVDNPSSLERVLYTLAGQIAQIFSPSNICSDLGVSKPTLEKYVVYLEQSFLIFTLQNFSGSEPKRQKRGRKLFFVDTALRNAALQRGLSPLDDHAEMGLLLENIVASHLHALSQQTQVRLFHWREKKYEVDLVYDHPEAPMAFEVTSSARHDRESLYQFMETFPRFKGRCFVVGPKEQLILPADSWDQVGSLPVDSLLIACSQLTESFLRRNLDI